MKKSYSRHQIPIDGQTYNRREKWKEVAKEMIQSAWSINKGDSNWRELNNVPQVSNKDGNQLNHVYTVTVTILCLQSTELWSAVRAALNRVRKSTHSTVSLNASSSTTSETGTFIGLYLHQSQFNSVSKQYHFNEHITSQFLTINYDQHKNQPESRNAWTIDRKKWTGDMAVLNQAKCLDHEMSRWFPVY